MDDIHYSGHFSLECNFWYSAVIKCCYAITDIFDKIKATLQNFLAKLNNSNDSYVQENVLLTSTTLGPLLSKNHTQFFGALCFLFYCFYALQLKTQYCQSKHVRKKIKSKGPNFVYTYLLLFILTFCHASCYLKRYVKTIFFVEGC